MAVEIGALRALLSLDSAAFEKGAKRAQAAMGDLERKVDQASRKLRASGRKLTRAVSLPLAGIATVAVRSSLKTIDAQSKMAQSLNTSTRSMQVLERAADRAGLSAGELSQISQQLTRRLSQAAAGGGPAAKSLERIGLSAEGLAGMDLDKQIEAINGAIAGTVPVAEQAAVAATIFGDRAGLLASRLDAQTIAAASNEIERFGVAVTEVEADQIEAANDAMSALGLVTRGLANQLAVALAPTLTAIAERIANVSEWFSKLSPEAKRFAGIAATVAAALGPVALTMGLLLMAIKPVVVALAALASPIGLLVGGLALLGAGVWFVVGRWDELTERFPILQTVLDGVLAGVEIFRATFVAAWDELVLQASNAVDLIQESWTTLREGFNSAVSFFKDIKTTFELAVFDISLAMARGLDAAIEAVGLFGKAVYDRLTDGLSEIGEFGTDLSELLLDMGRQALEAAKRIGEFVVDGIRQGISQKFDDLKRYVSDLGADMLQALRDRLGIRSPSREFAEVGRWSVEGLVVGIDDNASKAIDRARQLGTEIGKGVQDGLEPVLATVFDGLVRGDIKSIGPNLKNMAQSALSGLLQDSFKVGGGGFGGLLTGLRDSVIGIGSALSGAGSLVTRVGGAIGAALPVLGAVSAVFSFFKKTVEELDRGIRVTTSGMDALIETFRTTRTTRFFGLSRKTATDFQIAGTELSDPIQATINSIGERVLALSDTLGLASDNLARTSFEFEVSTKDKTDEQIQQAIETEMARLGDTFANAVIGTFTEYLPDENEIARLEKELTGLATSELVGGRGEGRLKSIEAQLQQQRVAAETAIEVVHLNEAFSGLQREGEGSLALLERLVSELSGVNGILGLFGRELLQVDVAGAAAASKLVELAGGLEQFVATNEFIFENFLNDAEQDARLTEIALDQLNRTFGDLQFAIPQTHAQFMALLEAQDLNTEAGRQAYSALTSVAQAFVQLNGTAQQAASSIQAAAEATSQARRADVDAARDVLSARSTAANAALQDAENALRNAFAAERDRINAAYQSQVDAANASAAAAQSQASSAEALAQENLGLATSIRDALTSALENRRVQSALAQATGLAEATAFLKAAVAAGGARDLEGLEGALDVVANPSTALFESFADYQQDFNVNTNLISKLKDLSDSSLSIEQRMLDGIRDQVSAVEGAASQQISVLQRNHEAQLGALDNQMSALLGIDNGVTSLASAIANFEAAQQEAEAAALEPEAPSTQFQPNSFGAQLDAIYRDLLGRGVREAGLNFYGDLYVEGFGLDQIRADILQSAERRTFLATGVPRFSIGGNFAGGARIVGENGPELEFTGPSRIYSSARTKSLMRDDTAARQRAETNGRLREMQKEINRVGRIVNDWQVNGQPGTRDGATVLTEAAP